MSVTHATPTGRVGEAEWLAEHNVTLTAADVGAATSGHNHDAAYSASGHTHGQLHDRAHAIASTDDHTAAGLTGGHVLRATGATTFAWGAIQDADLPATIARDSEVATAVSDHVAAADPHTGYVRENDANWTDLTDGGQTALHTHAGGTGAPTTVDYLVGTASADLSAEIVVGTSPGGELGGTWASPTVDATHSGSSHAATQAAAEATAATALSDHVAAADPHTGYRLESADHTHASSGLQGGQIAYSALTGYPGLTSASAFATAETTISAATYADITGCSVSLAAGTWLVFGHVIARAVNAIIQVFVAITHSDNTVIAESAISRPASGTANLNSPVSVSWFAIVSPGSTTTYKLRGARGLTTHTGSWIAMDGNGVNTANHASNNTDKGSGIFALRIA